MPYPITKNKDGQFCVNGKCYEDRAKAVAYQKALYANSSESEAKPKPKPKPKPKGGYGSKEEDSELELHDKSYYNDDYSYMGASKIDPQDSRANYGPLKGGATEACANCQWFNPKGACCDIIWGDIVATGYCDLWLELPGEYEQNPIPVVIVEDKEEEKRDPISGSKILTWLKNTFGVKQDQPLEGFGFKSLPNGKWVSYHTNNFEDKAVQILSEKSHDQYIEWVDKGLIPMPELWYWHIPGTRHGEAEWLGRVGHIVISAGSYDDTPRAQLFRKEYEQHPHKVSHTFGFPPEATHSGVYDAYFTVEISPLPAGRECNPITSFMEVKEMPVSDEKRAKLNAILGEKEAAAVLSDAETISNKFESIGLKWKGAEDLVAAATTAASADQEARDEIKKVATANKQVNETLADQVRTIALVVKELADGEEARNKQVTDLIATVQTMFELQPRASQSPATVIPRGNAADPMSFMAEFLAAKQAPQGTDAPKSVFDQISDIMIAGTQKQNGGTSAT